MPSRSEALFNRAKKVIPGGVSSPVRFYEPFPFFVSSALGSKLTTADHKTCIDYCMGYGAIVLGHSYPSVIDSVRSQLDKGTLFCTPSEKEVLLCESISKLVPCAEMVRLVNTGSEATMHAIRLSRAFTKKKKVIKFDGCYHGAYDYVLVKAGSGAATVPSSEGVLEETSSHTLVVPYNDSAGLERTIERNPDVACVIIEPVLANMGLILPDRNYLNEVRSITRQKDVVLIFDEVVTGFRLGLGGAGEFFGVKPDIATFAKALGNGFPIAAIAGRAEIMQQLSPSGSVYQASTFAGNAISVTASMSCLGALMEAKNSIYPQMSRMCDSVTATLRDEAEDLKLNCVVNSIGSMYQLFFTSDKVRDASGARKSDQAKFRRLYDYLLKDGVFIPPSQFETCFLSYSHSEDDCDRTVEAYRNALGKIRDDKV